MKHTTKNAYWVDPNSGKPRFEFNEMYKDLGDPWGCEEKNHSLTNRFFLELLFDQSVQYNRIVDLGAGKGSLTNLVYQKYESVLKDNVLSPSEGESHSKEQNRPFEMIGLEYSEVAVNEARKLNPKIEFQTFNLLESTTIPYNDVDLVILSEVLWYLVSDLANVFRKIHRCMSDSLEKKSVLGIHQFFPGSQQYFKEYIDGEIGFEMFLEKEKLFHIDQKVKCFQQNNDSVILYKLIKR